MPSKWTKPKKAAKTDEPKGDTPKAKAKGKGKKEAK